MATPREPAWTTLRVAEAIHGDQLASHGGLPGLRDARLLGAALGRPKYRWQHREVSDLADCAASYGFGLAKNHPFADANKRTAFVVMATFYELNGVVLVASEEDAVLTMIAVADGSMSEAQLADWLRANSSKQRTRRNK